MLAGPIWRAAFPGTKDGFLNELGSPLRCGSADLAEPFDPGVTRWKETACSHGSGYYGELLSDRAMPGITQIKMAAAHGVFQGACIGVAVARVGTSQTA